MSEFEGVLSVMVIVVGNGIDDLSSNPRLGCLHVFHFVLILLGQAHIYVFSQGYG